MSRFITIGLAALLALAAAPGLASASPASVVDEDFAGGTSDAATTVIPAGTLLQLKRNVAIDEGFDSAPAWIQTPTLWDPAGTAKVLGGALNVDGALVGP